MAPTPPWRMDEAEGSTLSSSCCHMQVVDHLAGDGDSDRLGLAVAPAGARALFTHDHGRGLMRSSGVAILRDRRGQAPVTQAGIWATVESSSLRANEGRLRKVIEQLGQHGKDDKDDDDDASRLLRDRRSVMRDIGLAGKHSSLP